MIRKSVRSRHYCPVVPPRSIKAVYADTDANSFSPVPTSNTEPSGCARKLVLAPENTGCDTVCMRLAVGLAGGRDQTRLAWNAAGNNAAGDRSCCRGHFLGPRHAWRCLFTFLTGISFFCHASHATAAHARCQLARAMGPGTVPEPAGCRFAALTTASSFDSEVPGSKIYLASRIINLVVCSDIKPRLHWAGQRPAWVGAN